MRDVDQEPEAMRREPSPPPANPRLSPLLNPLLAQQMGRWAHVYYTTPIDQREAAVEQLVRELEAESAMIAGGASAPAISAAEATGQFSDKKEEEATKIQNAEPIEDQELAEPSEIREPVAEGARIAEPAGETPMAASDTSLAPLIAKSETDLSDVFVSAPHPPVPQVEVPEVEVPQAAVSQVQVSEIDVPQIEASQPRPDFESALASDLADSDLTDNDLAGNEFPHEATGSGISFQPWMTKSWQAPSRSRVAAASLVAAVAVLLWAAPRIATRIATRASVQPSTQISAAPTSSGTKEPPAKPSAVAPSAVTGSEETSSLEHGQAPVAPRHIPARSGPARTPAALATNLAANPATNPASNTFEKLGDKKEEDPELTVGLRYLHGDGVERDSEVAAHHLWKAVGKQNASALLELAGLYAKGDGVAKNCDQARVLILAAARQAASPVQTRRVEDARETLQTSGCE